jgi:LEA14-like dessication related protein
VTILSRSSTWASVLIAVLALTACASLLGRDPLQVTLAGVDPLPGEGLELRMAVKLRVQNPNDVPIDYDGVYLRLAVANRTVATGVSDERGTIARFGQSIVRVPVTVSPLRLGMSVFGVLSGGSSEKMRYTLDGKVNGPAFGTMRFQSQGDLSLPGLLSP